MTAEPRYMITTGYVRFYAYPEPDADTWSVQDRWNGGAKELTGVGPTVAHMMAERLNRYSKASAQQVIDALTELWRFNESVGAVTGPMPAAWLMQELQLMGLTIVVNP